MALIEKKVSSGRGWLVLNNPKKGNALSFAMFDELEAGFNEFSQNPDIKIILVTSTGEVFSLGADINDIINVAKEKNGQNKVKETINRVHKLFLEISKSQKPTIAAINGFCLGGGLELALACDFRVAQKSAFFGFPEVSIGIIPGAGGTQRLPRLIGARNALKMILETNAREKKFFSAHNVLEFGLLDAVFEGNFRQDVVVFAEKVLANQIQKKQPLQKPYFISDPGFNIKTFAIGRPYDAAHAAYKAVFDGSSSFDKGLLLETELFVKCLFSEDARIGLTSIVTKKAPCFTKVVGE